MTKDAILFTAQMLWPLCAAVIVWIITMRLSADADEISNVVEALTHKKIRARTPHLYRNATVQRDRPGQSRTMRAAHAPKLQTQLRKRRQPRAKFDNTARRNARL